MLPGTYNVALVVDGKTVDTKPLKVAADPEVGLTAIERKKLYDMAMEMHELQRVANAVLGRHHAAQHPDWARSAKEMASRNDVPADVKASCRSASRRSWRDGAEVRAGGGGGRRRRRGRRAAAAPRGCGRAGGASTPAGQRGRAHHAGEERHDGRHLADVEQTTKAYADAKAQAPKAMAEANAVIAKAATLSATLAKYKVTLTAPEPVKIPASMAAGTKK